jgi:protein transport protein SEC13
MAGLIASDPQDKKYNIETNHDDMIHDIQFDYYSKRVASCSSDRTIKIFDVQKHNGTLLYHMVANLSGHEGPVWQVAWAHPKFTPQLLASCSYDGSVIIYQEVKLNSWTKMHQYSIEDGSINSVSWAPHEVDFPMLAFATSQGSFGIIHFDRSLGIWKEKKFESGDNLGCNAVSWAPAGSLGSDSKKLQLVTGHCDNLVRVWEINIGDASSDNWTATDKSIAQKENFRANGWVRDVAWAPNTSMPFNIIASCSDDNFVRIYQQTSLDSEWVKSEIDLRVPVWRVSWSVTGNILAVSTSSHTVNLYKQAIDGSWVQIANADK